ncbi:hypothetical protein ACJJTC_002647 [Scirpophaga incertulas]
MQTVRKSTENKIRIKKPVKDEKVAKKPLDEKVKITAYPVSTPRSLLQKSAADIYGQTKNSSTISNKTHRTVLGATNKSRDAAAVKGSLKSSSSTVSHISARNKTSSVSKSETKVPSKHATQRTTKPLSTNVTVNSPTASRTIFKDRKSDTQEILKRVETKEDKTKKPSKDSKVVDGRERSKTKTLKEDEIKILTVDGVDNNAEMHNLSRKLAAKPKAFYVDLDDSKNIGSTIQNKKSSEDEVSYEDDFESYESDFESYHESHSENESTNDNNSIDDKFENNLPKDDNNLEDDVHKNNTNNKRQGVNVNKAKVKEKGENENTVDVVSKDMKDEEKMLDSGNYELRETRSASKSKHVMDFISEGSEVDMKSSLTDEGFQDMTSSAVSSMKTVHTEVLERPFFIDFSKSKQNKRKRKVFERLKQRAIDILNMVTLHEMSYSLFEMKPIPYDVYMAMFGRSNYMQSSTQTFDSGVNEEIQTDTIVSENKWTQHPIQFSNSNIYLNAVGETRKLSAIDDYLTKFTLAINNAENDKLSTDNTDEDYISNPLRMYFEQKDGAGTCTMLPYDNYKNKLSRNEFNNRRLGKFLNKVETKVSSILSANVGFHTNDVIKMTKYVFSRGYTPVAANNVEDKKTMFLAQTKVTAVVLSESKSHLIITIHTKCPSLLGNKNVLCLWDVSVALQAPLKMLVAVQNVSLARFKGSVNGVLVAALTDGSVHLWDLSEKPTWQPNVLSEQPTDVEVAENEILTHTEKDREWNKLNSHTGFSDTLFSSCLLQACAYTTSAAAMMDREASTLITGLEVTTKLDHSYESSRRVLGQVSALQRLGVITIWSIIQERIPNDSKDLGKAYWSKMKLEKNQTIYLVEQLWPTSNSLDRSSFNLNAAKMRIAMRKKERTTKSSRQKSAMASERPASVAASKISLDDSIICTDLKVMRLNDTINYLVAKNCGEVLCCTKILGVVKINRFCVATDFATVTNLEVSPSTSPNFLAATDTGTVNLCSLARGRVLLTLDCRTDPLGADSEKYEMDSKGRNLGSSLVRQQNVGFSLRPDSGIAVKSVVWCATNPCCLYALLASGALVAWDLASSDIRARCNVDRAAVSISCSGNALALVTPDGEVQVHRLNTTTRDSRQLDLFNKYVSLL